MKLGFYGKQHAGTQVATDSLKQAISVQHIIRTALAYRTKIQLLKSYQEAQRRLMNRTQQGFTFCLTSRTTPAATTHLQRRLDLYSKANIATNHAPHRVARRQAEVRRPVNYILACHRASPTLLLQITSIAIRIARSTSCHLYIYIHTRMYSFLEQGHFIEMLTGGL